MDGRFTDYLGQDFISDGLTMLYFELSPGFFFPFVHHYTVTTIEESPCSFLDPWVIQKLSSHIFSEVLMWFYGALSSIRYTYYKRKQRRIFLGESGGPRWDCAGGVQFDVLTSQIGTFEPILTAYIPKHGEYNHSHSSKASSSRLCTKTLKESK